MYQNVFAKQYIFQIKLFLWLLLVCLYFVLLEDRVGFPFRIFYGNIFHYTIFECRWFYMYNVSYF